MPARFTHAISVKFKLSKSLIGGVLHISSLSLMLHNVNEIICIAIVFIVLSIYLIPGKKINTPTVKSPRQKQSMTPVTSHPASST